MRTMALIVVLVGLFAGVYATRTGRDMLSWVSLAIVIGGIVLAVVSMPEQWRRGMWRKDKKADIP